MQQKLPTVFRSSHAPNKERPFIPCMNDRRLSGPFSVTRFRIFNQIDSTSADRNGNCKKYTTGERSNAQHKQHQTHSVRHVLPPAIRHTCAFSSMRE